MSDVARAVIWAAGIVAALFLLTAGAIAYHDERTAPVEGAAGPYALGSPVRVGTWHGRASELTVSCRDDGIQISAPVPAAAMRSGVGDTDDAFASPAGNGQVTVWVYGSNGQLASWTAAGTKFTVALRSGPASAARLGLGLSGRFRCPVR